MEDKVIVDLQESYGVVCRLITPVAGGWLNRKWRVDTGAGEALVKQFSNERYSREKLRRVEAALQRQIQVASRGVACPRIWRCGGRAIRLLDDETAYMVMEFRPGRIESPETVTNRQLFRLGDACGLLHKAFAQLPVQSVEGYPINSQKEYDGLWANFLARRDGGGPAAYRRAVLAQEPILRRLTPSFFDRLPKGIAHEDFTPDNMLFDGDAVSALLDFDRNRYSFVWHDVGRAILSFALLDDRLDVEKLRAFQAGYSRHAVLTPQNAVDALRLTWCIETPWWIQPEFFRENSNKVTRFREEMLWLTEHWFALDSMLGC